MCKLSLTTLLLIGILILGGFLRFYDLSTLPPGLYPDEAMNGTNALEALHTGNFRVFYPENNGREGLFINIQALSVWLFGNEPWTLRVVSAIFGTFTILGVYLVMKKLFQDKSQIISTKPQTISNDRNSNTQTGVESLNFRNWNLFGIWKLEFEISRGEIAALLSSFFLATNYWHINFSRIGFRAITVPFFAAFGIYWLLKGLRTGKILSIALAGIFIGLGFHTYIAFRFIPFVLAVPIIFALVQWQREKNQKNKQSARNTNSVILITNGCAPCAIVLFLFITFVIALPIGWYFLQNPADFFGRGEQVSIFAADRPLYEFIKSNLITLQMFFWIGDCNPRHNLACKPELHPIVAVFFLLGVIINIRDIFRKPTTYNLQLTTLFAWLFFMSLPATLTTEGLPHALRAIGMIPPVMIFAGLGAYRSYEYLQNLLIGYAQNPRFTDRTRQMGRIQKEILIVFLLFLATVAFSTYKTYFVYFEKARATYSAFRVDLLNMARYIDSLPETTEVYLLANYPDTRYGIPLEAEVIQYITDTARQDEQDKKRIRYLLPEELPRIRTALDAGERTELIPMNAREKGGINGLLAQFPELKLEVMDDFAILRNYQR